MSRTRIRRFSVSAFLGLTSVLFLSNSCKHDGVTADQMPEICFTEQVLPIFKNNCATSGCHDSKAEAGYILSDYNNILKAVKPGNANKSKAYQAITSTFKLMPPKMALSTSDRTIIRLWIEQGASDKNCGTTK